MSQLIHNDLSMIIVALAVIALVSLILAIIALNSNARLRRQVRRWKNIHATADLDKVYADTVESVKELGAAFAELENKGLGAIHAELQTVHRILRHKITTPSVDRYNAFDDQGSDLSFSVAFLDDEQTGVVMSSIYGREESRTYAKPVQRGASRYPLTNEETGVISQVASTSERGEDKERRGHR